MASRGTTLDDREDERWNQSFTFKGVSMRRIALWSAAVLFVWAPTAFAQNHGEVGVYADYFRLHTTGSNFGGLGGRLSVNAAKYVQIEAEMNYDFRQIFTEGFRNNSTGSVTLQNTNLRVLHGLFGPKLQTGSGPVRLFFTVKGGFADFRIDPRPATFATFTSSVSDLRAHNVNFALYPGVGAEAYLGPIGVRVDIGDEIYWSGGANHNWRVTFGPHFRF
jgi:hypothetical protein